MVSTFNLGDISRTISHPFASFCRPIESDVRSGVRSSTKENFGASAMGIFCCMVLVLIYLDNFPLACRRR